MKVAYVDLDTTGLNPDVHEVIRMGLMIEEVGIIKETAVWKMKPTDVDSINPESLSINGYRLDEILSWPEPSTVINRISDFLAKYVDPYNKEDKLVIIAHNSRNFTVKFLRAFFQRHKTSGSLSFGNWFDHHPLDTLDLARWYEYDLAIDFSNLKSATICKHFGVTINPNIGEAASLHAMREMTKHLLIG